MTHETPYNGRGGPLRDEKGDLMRNFGGAGACLLRQVAHSVAYRSDLRWSSYKIYRVFNTPTGGSGYTEM